MSLDAAITNLYTLLYVHFTNIDSGDVRVFDGQPIEDTSYEAVVVGMTAEDLATDGRIEDAGLYVDQETFDVNCLIRVWDGSSNLERLRTRATAIYETAKEQVRVNPTLNGAVTRARVASVAYSPARMPDGTSVNMVFRVRCITLTS